jgi:chemotaxis regulatin CheY-phosphate phosphatase CheZ
MTENLKITHENFVSIVKDLIIITDTILKNVVSKTEQAALEIGNKIESVSSLSGDQAKMVKGLITSMYEEGTEEHLEVEKMAKEANSMADEIFESAAAGDLDKAKSLGESDRYKELGTKTGNLSKQLEKLSESDKELANMIMPVIMALQFQDSVRQSLENIIKCFQEFADRSQGITQQKLSGEFEKDFWTILENKFTTTDERNIVRKTVYGENAKLIEDTAKTDPFMF